jgi:predicted nucleic acid-binding protein
MIVVADASPLIAMSRVGRLDLLREVFGQLLVPEAVWIELTGSGIERAGSSEIAAATWIERREAMDRQLVESLKRILGAGEAEAIVLAKETNADVLLMDERLGRSTAHDLGLSVVGLVGVLIEARDRGLLSDAKSLVAALDQEAGFWISAELRSLITG